MPIYLITPLNWLEHTYLKRKVYRNSKIVLLQLNFEDTSLFIGGCGNLYHTSLPLGNLLLYKNNLFIVLINDNQFLCDVFRRIMLLLPKKGLTLEATPQFVNGCDSVYPQSCSFCYYFIIIHIIIHEFEALT